MRTRLSLGSIIGMIEAREAATQSLCAVFVRSPRRAGLIKVLTGIGATVFAEPCGGLSVTGVDACRIAAAAAAHYIPIQELTPRAVHHQQDTSHGTRHTR